MDRRPPDDEDLYDDDEDFDEEDEELEELNQLDEYSAPTPFLERAWVRWVGIGLAAVLLASVLIPVLGPLFGSDDEPGSNVDGQPDFVLPAANGGNVQLSDISSPVVLVFYRSGSSAGAQLDALQAGYQDIRAQGAEVIAIGGETLADVRLTASRSGAQFPVLADQDRTIIGIYQMTEPLASEFVAAVWILDEQRRAVTQPLGVPEGDVLPASAIVDALRQMNGQTGTST